MPKRMIRCGWLAGLASNALVLTAVVVGPPLLLSLPKTAGAVSYLEAPATAAYDVTSSGFTVECWVKVRGLPGFDPRIIRCVGPTDGPCGNPAVDVWELSICNRSCTTGKVGFSIVPNGVCNIGEIQSTAAVTDGAFHHLAGTYDGAIMKVYVDGVLSNSRSSPGLSTQVSGGKLVVGNSTDYNNAFDGQIDEIRVWSLARTESQIAADMTTEITPEPGLVGYWKLNGDGIELIGGNILVPHGSVTFVAGRLNQAVDIDNGPPPPSLQFSSGSFSVSEGGGGATITVTRSGGVTAAVSVNYATSDGSAASGSDYQVASGSLSWASGDPTPKTFSVPISQDAQVEGNETINLALSSPTGGATLGNPSAATLTIQDDDPPALQFSSESFHAYSEGGGGSTITVTRSGDPTAAVSVNYTTSDGSATSGSDYLPAFGSLSWASGDTAPKGFSIPVLQDTLVESNETINLALSGPTGGAMLGNPSAATLTILDDDSPPVSCDDSGEAFLGVYGDAAGTQPCIVLPAGTPSTLYLWANNVGASMTLGSPMDLAQPEPSPGDPGEPPPGPIGPGPPWTNPANGITGAEFRIIVTNPNGYLGFSSFTPAPGLVTMLGNPIDTTPIIDDLAGMNLAFPACQENDGRVFLGSIDIFNGDGGPTDLIVTRKSPTSNPAVGCALFTRCDAPEFSLAAMRTISSFNGEPVAFQARIVGATGDCAPTDSPVPSQPSRLTLLGNVPDPFNPTTEIRYSLPEVTTVTVAIYDIRGRLLDTIFTGIQSAGRQSALWDGRLQDGRRATSGVYFARIATQKETAVERLTLIK